MSQHAILSPSSGDQWMLCPGSVALSANRPDNSNAFSEEGTDAHELASKTLEAGGVATDFLGEAMSKGYVVDLDMANNVQTYVNYVLDLQRGVGGDLLVEQRLSIEHLTGEPGAHGTADAVIIADEELIVVDLKYGRGVPVEAEGNRQLRIYGLAALRDYEWLADFKRVRMVIHQPRLNSVLEWVQTVEQMEAFAIDVHAAADATRAPGAVLVPGNRQCKFCRAKAVCPALAAKVQEEIGADFDEIIANGGIVVTQEPEALSKALRAADLIEGFLKAVRAEVETQMLAGQHIPGFKLVQGKKGNRQWASKEEAEAALKTMRVKHEQMYDYSVISPTSAEKLANAEVIGPRQWPKLLALITQSDGKPSVAPESDKRPALAVAAVTDDFEAVDHPATTPATAETCDLV